MVVISLLISSFTNNIGCRVFSISYRFNVASLLARCPPYIVHFILICSAVIPSSIFNHVALLLFHFMYVQIYMLWNSRKEVFLIYIHLCG